MRASLTTAVHRNVPLNVILAFFLVFTALLQVIGAEKVIRKAGYTREPTARETDLKRLEESIVKKEAPTAKGRIIPPSSYQKSEKRRRSIAKEDIADGGRRKTDQVDSYAGEVPSVVRFEDSLTTVSKPIDVISGTPQAVDPFDGNRKSLADWQLEDYVIAITIKGNIYATSRTDGHNLWTVMTDDLWSVKRHQDSESPEDEDVDWIIEPGNGGALYSHTLRGGLQRQGAFRSMRYISENSPYQARNGLTLTGSTATEIYTINPLTGEFLSSSSGSLSNGLPDKCKKRTRLEGLDDDEECTVRKVSLARTDYTVHISHPERGMLWTLTYTEWGIGTQNRDLADQYTQSLDDKYLYPLKDGKLICRNIKETKPTFVVSFDEPVAQIFDVAGNRLDKSLVLLPHPKDPEAAKNTMGNRILANIEGGSGVFALPYAVESSTEAAPMPEREDWLSMDLQGRRKALQGVREIREFPMQRTLEAPSPNPNPENYHHDVARTNGGPRTKSWTDTAGFQVTALLMMMSAMWFAGRYSTDMALTSVKDVQVVVKEDLPPQLATEVQNEATADDFVIVPVPQTAQNKKVVQFAATQDPEAGSDEDDGDKAAAPTTPKKKRVRGARGKGKRNRKKKEESEAEEKKSNGEPEERSGSDKSISVIHNPELLMSNANGQVADDLFVSNDVLGIGSHGTRVFRGRFGDREVAVKRLLVDSYDLASHEVNLLQRVDDHPNVVRYFCQKQTDLFLYIALELCPASLQDVLEAPQHRHILNLLDPPEVLRQMTLGVQHLHSLKIVHRDLKPQNILVAEPKRSLRNPSEIKHPKILISDFGLCKKLEPDQSSFRATTAHAAGTSGWRAPELLISESGDIHASSLSEHTNGSTSDSSVLDTLTNRRATRAIDIFSLGCVFYFVLTRGSHPFGDRYLREGNIITGSHNLSGLEILGDSGAEAKDLIASMIARHPKLRPDATAVLTHPFFWSAEKKLNFLLDVSDRFEKEERDPPSPLLQQLESYSGTVFNGDWYKKLDKSLIDNLGKHRKYQGDRMLDLLRALRNKKHHYQDLPPAVQATVGNLPEGYLNYFTSRFPLLLVSMFRLVQGELRHEHMWRGYFTA
ncbi:Endoribonuclease [Orbilia brochopaga]|nr:Endoribonuclease [Drechslerella brochopaga]